MKTIVTHISPDLDAVTSVWLIKRFLPDWHEADIVFVPVETTWNDKDPDSDPDVIHVDTGHGKFDHHGSQEITCAAKLVYNFLNENPYFKKKDALALERIVEYVTQIDNFREVNYPNPEADLYDFMPHQLIFGMRPLCANDHELIEQYFVILEGMLIVMKNKLSAENDLKEGFVFTSKWGKSIAFESKNEESVKLALKHKYDVAIKKDPSRGFLKIKSFPGPGHDLAELFAILKNLDKKAHWALQGANHIIINGSSRVPNSVATTLTLAKVIAIMKEM